MKVLIVEPGKYPREADIEHTLEAEQAVVGGTIDRFGDFSPTLFYCLCVQPCFLLLRQVRLCRILFRGIISPAFYQYVRLHSDTLPHTFKRITHVWVHDAKNHWQRLRQVGASYRCIGPDSTLCIVRIHFYITLNAGKCQ